MSGKYSANQQFEGDDVRRVITPVQLSLAWMLHKEDFIVPIPGMRKQYRLEENFKAASVELTEEEFEKIESALDKLTIHGNRTDEAIQALGFLDQSYQ